MKDTTSSADNSSKFSFVKSLPIALLISAACALIFAVLLSLAAYFVDFPEWGYSASGILIACIMAFVCAYICVRSTRKNGLVSGLICGGITFLILFVISFIINSEGVGIADNLTRLLFMALSGSIGGVLAVNTRKKRK